MKMPEKKRRHHYVWRHYLEAWETSGQLWCLRRGGSPFRVSARNVAVQTDFYRLREMTSSDLEFARGLIRGMESPLVRDLCQGWVEMFTEIHTLKRKVEAQGDVPEPVRTAFDIALNNAEEDLHGRIEGEAGPLLASLRDGRLDVLESDEDFPTFSFFLATQHLRTRGMRQVTIDKVRPEGVDVDAAWGLIRAILATGLSYNLNARRSLMEATILDAPQPLEFLAGDQPLFNVRGVGKSGDTPPKELEIYYPLSPSKALLIDFGPQKPGISTRDLSQMEVATFNWMTTQEAHEQVFASKQSTLQEDVFDF